MTRHFNETVNRTEDRKSRSSTKESPRPNTEHALYVISGALPTSKQVAGTFHQKLKLHGVKTYGVVAAMEENADNDEAFASYIDTLGRLVYMPRREDDTKIISTDNSQQFLVVETGPEIIDVYQVPGPVQTVIIF
jgi:hypothetical protein